MSQLAFDLAQRGAALAADKADRMHNEWSSRAFEAFKTYAEAHEAFSTEDVILASPSIQVPPDKRAWGHVALRAAKEGICHSAGVAKSKLAHAHGRWITRWASNIFSPASV